MEKAMAPHSSTLAWKIPWTEKPGGLPSVGLHRVGHDWSDLAAAAATTSFPWWKTILIVIILIVLFLLFAPCICNCVTGFVSNHPKAFKLKWLSKLLWVPQPLQLLLGGPGSETLNVRVRGIWCLNNLGTVPHPSRKYLWNENTTPFPLQHNSSKRKRGAMRVSS